MSSHIQSYCIYLFFIVFSVFSSAQSVNGFDLSELSIDASEVLSGGPPRDGIPSLDEPKFISVDQVTYLRNDDILLSLQRGETVRAYPFRILIWHEIVNDVIGGDAVAVTYCPLCGTGMVFDRFSGDSQLTFGVSGLLYRSDVLMYDRETDSLWSQLAMEAVSGPNVGKKLNWLPAEHMNWAAFKSRYPEGQVLSTNTGYSRRYIADAYESYFASEETMFPVPHTRTELPNKTKVLGVLVDDEARAYPLTELAEFGELEQTIGSQKVSISYQSEAGNPLVVNELGEVLPSVVVFWFAWQAFYPDTDLWQQP